MDHVAEVRCRSGSVEIFVPKNVNKVFPFPELCVYFYLQYFLSVFQGTPVSYLLSHLSETTSKEIDDNNDEKDQNEEKDGMLSLILSNPNIESRKIHSVLVIGDDETDEHMYQGEEE